MRYQGKLQDWHDERGFGFVVPNGGGERAFVHIKAFAPRQRRPAEGELISYLPRHDERGRLLATDIRLVAVSTSDTPRRGQLWPLWLLPGFVLLVFGLHLAGRLPAMLLLGLAVLSGLAFASYAQDKAAARRGQWRTPESTLQGLALLGGWPGALLAQHLLRHKSSKAGFQTVFRASVVLNVAAVGALALWQPF